MTTHDPRAAAIADALETAYPLFARFLIGFTKENHTKQAPGLPNHAAWTLGHLALYHHRATDLLMGYDDLQPLHEHDFIEGDGYAATTQRIDARSVCFGSTPTDEPARYPLYLRLVDIHERAWARLTIATREASPSMLRRVVPWGNSSIRADALVIRMMMHMGTHGGQLTDLRRGLGMPGAIG